MNLTDNLVLIVISIMAGITFVVSYRVLTKTLLGGAAIPLCVAGLAFLGLWTIAREWIELILAEYATLAVCLLGVLIVAFISGKTSSKGDSSGKPWTPFKGKW